MPNLDILIPARSEMFLWKTIEDILENIEGDTEIIAVADGDWPEPPINDNPRVHLIYHPESIGQRAATNEAARLSQAKFVMKCDAHCAFDKGFDVKMIREMKPEYTMVPVMRNLHVFDWVCNKCGDRRYQGPTPTSCPKCDNTQDFERDVVWTPKTNPQSTSYCFDSEPHFQYFREFQKRPEGKGDLTETMSLQGSCFMVTREKYFELNLCDEEFGSWGSQGIEVAVKTWLSGGRVICNHKTWYGHCFRTQGGDFGFPYKISGKQVQFAKNHAKDLFFNNKWPKQTKPLIWLLDKFKPVPGWSEKDLAKVRRAGDVNANTGIGRPTPVSTTPLGARVAGTNNKRIGIIYYTDNRLDEKIFKAVQRQIQKCANGHEIVSASLKPIDFGKNVTLHMERSILTMFKQILAALELSSADIIYFCEHDVLYHPAHFRFIPPKKDLFYYDQNKWNVRAKDGHALFYHSMSLSMMCAHRDLLLSHYQKRVERVEREGVYDRRIGYEPGGHRFPRGIDDYGRDVYFADGPSIDIRHDMNFTHNRWRKKDFRNQKPLHSWKEAEEIPYWGRTKGRFKEILDAI